jgi:hypothetical protein
LLDCFAQVFCIGVLLSSGAAAVGQRVFGGTGNPASWIAETHDAPFSKESTVLKARKSGHGQIRYEVEGGLKSGVYAEVRGKWR